MIQSVSSASSVSQLYLQQQQQNAAANKPKAVQKPKQDTVELSQQAQQAAKAHQKGKGS